MGWLRDRALMQGWLGIAKPVHTEPEPYGRRDFVCTRRPWGNLSAYFAHRDVYRSAVRNNDPTDYELHDKVEDLVARGLLERNTPAYRIAQQVVHRGYESLSDQQRAIYASIIVPTLELRAAQREIQSVWDRKPDPD